MNTFKNINPKEFVELLKDRAKYKIIDCRTIDEIKQQSLDYDFHIDLYDASTHIKLKDLNPNNNYIIYCNSGSRSSYLCDYLFKNGFANVYNLEGGISNWNFYKNSNLI